MSVTKTPRLNLAKQTVGDPNWSIALDQGFTDADTRLLKISPDFSNATDPNGTVAGDFVGQLYYDLTISPPRIWICTTAGAAGVAVFELINVSGIGISSPYFGLTNLADILNAITPQTGTVWPTFQQTPNVGWIFMEDQTIGHSASGADYANNYAFSLFVVMWTQCDDSICPVSGGRGGSAISDWGAHKTLLLPKALGRILASAGSGAGLTTRIIGASLGEEAHEMQPGELVAHFHTVEIRDGGGTGFASKAGGPFSATENTSITGGSPPSKMNVMQPTTFVNRYMIKL